MGARLVAVVMVALALAGPFQSLALAQQTSQPPQSQPAQPEPAAQPPQPEPAAQPPQPEPAAQQPPQPEPAAQPQMYQGSVQGQPAPEPQQAPRRKTDGYDVGAGIMTVAGAPLKAGVCVVGTVAAALLFILTFGSADAATAATFEEGCTHQRWVVRGDDLRPPAVPQTLMRERYDAGAR